MADFYHYILPRALGSIHKALDASQVIYFSSSAPLLSCKNWCCLKSYFLGRYKAHFNISKDTVFSKCGLDTV